MHPLCTPSQQVGGPAHVPTRRLISSAGTPTNTDPAALELLMARWFRGGLTWQHLAGQLAEMRPPIPAGAPNP